MITDDDVMQLFEQADPARVLPAAPLLDAGPYLDTLRLRSTDMTLTDITPTSTPFSPRNRRITVAAMIVVALLIAGSAIALFVRRSTRQSVTHPPPAMQVATDFLAAYTAYDADQVSSLLADDADVSGLFQRSDWRLGLRFMQATRLEITVRSCVETASLPSKTLVECPYVFHALGSEELGLGPFSGGVVGLTIRDGRVVDAVVNVPFALTDDQFKNEMWEPFASWVATSFPDDAAVMYTDQSHIAAAITEESIPLWEQHTRDYVDDDMNQKVVAYIVQAKEICRAARAELDAKPVSDRMPDSVDFVLAAIGPAERALDKLHALPMPGERLVSFSVLNDQRMVVLHQIRDADSAGDAARTQQLIRQLSLLSAQIAVAMPDLASCPLGPPGFTVRNGEVVLVS